MDASSRSGPTRVMTLYVGPLVLLGLLLTVLNDRSRLGDERGLVFLILAAASAFYLKGRRLFALMAAFGVATLALDPTVPQWVEGPLRRLVATRVPPPSDAPPRDFDDHFEKAAVRERFEHEYRTYSYVLLNGLAFGALLAGSTMLKRRAARREAALDEV